MIGLTNKVVFITGASRGIGAAIANRFAAEGANVIFTYAKSTHRAKAQEEKLKTAGVKALAIQVDSADTLALQTAISTTVDQFGPIDILVNNAGIFPAGDFSEVTMSEFDETMNVHVKAVFVASQAVIKNMPEGGRIISIGSNVAEYAVTGNTIIYGMSKSALLGFTKGLARALGPKRITVNLVQPGPTDTDMNPADAPLADFLRSRMALPEYGTGDDIAGLVAFLASSEGSYITGSTITIDGGMNA
ncbi:3-oxoacyl-[acyl-carrier protein] reductase [Pedobacter westerhofensis]|uniref:3-oxoacyl-[acyl-carrier protein] reductase n=1 Tax=Pedobacter westerhofensis TaxID=425512 RepID=A0A521FKJ3_9SPHI|nr:3-oxoacyl-ACP reductase family protein [Pedobacter westerhofensis]SMO96723.1 3-oxoacyl-[acyl-carrier protein] reductase [Pedobacter westerhofensis]